MSRFEAWRRALILIGLVVLADQLTKQLAVEHLARQGPADLPLGFQFDYITNSGIAFGFFGGGQGLVTVVTAITVSGLLIWFALRPTRPGMWLATGLLVGGAIGNLADRARFDAVIDFIDPPRWPAFNLADVAITAGVVVLVLNIARSEEKE